MTIFQKFFGKKAEQKANFWTALPPKYDINQGYEVLCEPPIFLGWETTFYDLQRLKICTIREVYQNSFEYRFNYPVRVGTMILAGFKANFWLDDSMQNSIKNYECEIIAHDKQNFFIAKKLLEHAFSQYLLTDYRIVDNSNYEIHMKGITFTVFSYNSTLKIYNDRDFLGKRNIDKYEEIIELSSVLKMGKAKEIYTNYKKSNFIKSTPAIIKHDYPSQSLAWIDKKNDICGITGWENSIILPKAFLEKIVVEVMQPAKGGGFSAITLNIKGETSNLTLWMGNFTPIGEGNKTAEALSTFFNVPIEYNDLGYDC